MSEHRVICLSDSNAFVGSVTKTDTEWIFTSDPIYFSVRGREASDNWIKLTTSNINVPNWHTYEAELVVQRISNYVPDAVASASEAQGYGSTWTVLLTFKLRPITPLGDLTPITIPGYGVCTVPSKKVENADGTVTRVSPAVDMPIMARTGCELKIDGLDDSKPMVVLIGDYSMQSPPVCYEFGLTKEELRDELEVSDINNVSDLVSDYVRDGAVRVVFPDDESPSYKIYTRHGINYGDIVNMYDVKKQTGVSEDGEPIYGGGIKVITQVARPIVGDTVLCTPLSHISDDGEVTERYALAPVMLDGRYGIGYSVGNALISGYYNIDDYLSVGKVDLRYLDNCARHKIGEQVVELSVSTTYSPDWKIDPRKFLENNTPGYSNLSDIELPDTIRRDVALSAIRNVSSDGLFNDMPTLLNYECSLKAYHNSAGEVTTRKDYYGESTDLWGDVYGCELTRSNMYGNRPYISHYVSKPINTTSTTVTTKASVYYDDSDDAYSTLGVAGVPLMIDPNSVPRITNKYVEAEFEAHICETKFNGDIIHWDDPRLPSDYPNLSEYRVCFDYYIGFEPGTSMVLDKTTIEDEFVLDRPELANYPAVRPGCQPSAITVTAAVTPADISNNSYAYGISDSSVAVSGGSVGAQSVGARIITTEETTKDVAEDDRRWVTKLNRVSTTEESSEDPIELSVISPLSDIDSSVEDLNSKILEQIKSSGQLSPGMWLNSNNIPRPTNYSENIYAEANFTIQKFQLFADDGSIDSIGISVGMESPSYSSIYSASPAYCGSHGSIGIDINNFKHYDPYLSLSALLRDSRAYRDSDPAIVRLNAHNEAVTRQFVNEDGTIGQEEVTVRIFSKSIYVIFELTGELRERCTSYRSSGICKWIDPETLPDKYKDVEITWADVSVSHVYGTVANMEDARAVSESHSVPSGFGVPILEDYDYYYLFVEAEQYVKSITWDILADRPVVELAWRGVYRKNYKSLVESRRNIFFKTYSATVVDYWDPDYQDPEYDEPGGSRTDYLDEKSTFEVIHDSGLTADRYDGDDTGNVEFSEWSDEEFYSHVDVDKEFMYFKDKLNKYMPKSGSETTLSWDHILSKDAWIDTGLAFLDVFKKTLTDALEDAEKDLLSSKYIPKEEKEYHDENRYTTYEVSDDYYGVEINTSTGTGYAIKQLPNADGDMDTIKNTETALELTVK